MNTKLLLLELQRNQNISITFRDMEQIPEFLEMVTERSIDSNLLSLGDHQPIKKPVFSISKLEQWCAKNELKYLLDEQERVLHLSF